MAVSLGVEGVGLMGMGDGGWWLCFVVLYVLCCVVLLFALQHCDDALRDHSLAPVLPVTRPVLPAATDPQLIGCQIHSHDTSDPFLGPKL